MVSTTLEGPLDWPDATVVGGDAVDVVARLKEESEVPLRSHGSLSLNRGALMAAGLVDRVQVTLFPVITGQTGVDPIFQGAADFDLELLETRTLDGHIQELIYRPQGVSFHVPSTRCFLGRTTAATMSAVPRGGVLSSPGNGRCSSAASKPCAVTCYATMFCEKGGSMKVRYGAVLPLPPQEAFAFVADPVNWPLFFPGVRCVAKDDDWGRVGGHARLTTVVLGRSQTMDLELTEWDPPRAFRYTVSQGGKPGNDDNRRTFQPVAGGTRLTGTTEIPARRGPAGLLDRLQMVLVRRVFATAMARLPAAAAEHRNLG